MRKGKIVRNEGKRKEQEQKEKETRIKKGRKKKKKEESVKVRAGRSTREKSRQRHDDPVDLSFRICASDLPVNSTITFNYYEIPFL